MPIKNQGRSYVQYCFKDFVDLMEEWKKENKKVYIIGGGVDNCVFHMIFETMGVEHEILRNYCYSISFFNDWPDDLDGVSPENYLFRNHR